MELNIPHKFAKELLSKLEKDSDEYKYVNSPIYNYKDSGDEIYKYDSNRLSENSIKIIECFVKDNIFNRGVKGSWLLGNQIKEYFAIKLLESQADDDVTLLLNKEINTPLILATQLRIYIKKLNNPYFFRARKEDETFYKILITDVRYDKRYSTREGGIVPAKCTINYSYYELGEIESKSVTFSEDKHFGQIKTYDEVLKKQVTHYPTFNQLLRISDFILFNDSMEEQYQNNLIKWNNLGVQVGLQVTSNGLAKYIKSGKDGHYSWEREYWRYCQKDGDKFKLVIDRYKKNNDNKGSINNIKCCMAFEPKEGEEQKYNFQVPILPSLICYDLNNYTFIEINVISLDVYKYNPSLRDKLIIPELHKELIEILSQNSKVEINDIIAGKSGGVSILASGAPGVGKTLTAEVYSEVVERPLYNIQCSQLGLEIDKIEKNLQDVLDRASKWGAILLIDEADVYIRKRSEDIHQNAIVGVFLRLIEYYKGILFLTTNRGEMVDDAIISRMTAHIKYQLPTIEQQIAIWKTLSESFGLELGPNTIESIKSNFPNLSGRDIKNILKLIKLTLFKKDKNLKVTKKEIDFAIQFQDLSKDFK